jgi:hypothetical protein
MRSYNFLRAFEDRFVYEPGLFPPARESRPTRQRSIFRRHAKELVKKPGKYCESDVVVNGFSAEHLRQFPAKPEWPVPA